MLINILYVVLGAVGLSLLIFIHELGHYFAARKVRMRVEVFSIGFGKPLLKWTHQGVQWQIAAFLFGGYVKIAGMDKDKEADLSKVAEGYYTKTPLQRIFVAAAGPCINILFALIFFFVIWVTGGREKPFSEFTRIIGAMDKSSELYRRGVRAGDEITSLQGKPFEGFKDLLYTGAIKTPTVSIAGEKVDYYTGAYQSFHYDITPYPDPRFLKEEINMIGVLVPAAYLIYQGSHEGGPMALSGIEKGDRILWVNGELVFSELSLKRVINDRSALVVVKRGKNRFLAKVPRLQIADLRLTPEERAELDDWHYEAGIREKTNNLIFIPYVLNSRLVIQKVLNFINDEANESNVHLEKRLSHLDMALRPGDQILSIDGAPVRTGREFIQRLQTKEVQVIVKRGENPAPFSWQGEDQVFIRSIDWKNLSALMRGMVAPNGPKQVGDLVLLAPAIPLPLSDIPLPQEWRDSIALQKKRIEAIKDPIKQEEALKLFNDYQSKKVLGIRLADHTVIYNPSPFILCGDILNQTVRTLSALVTGKLSSKFLAGPIGMVHIMQQGWTMGFKEAFYWMGAISFSLGLLNLLPLPIFDGGHIVFSCVEMVTRRRLSPKAMERLILPFVVLLGALFIYLTYNDVLRLIHMWRS